MPSNMSPAFSSTAITSSTSSSASARPRTNSGAVQQFVGQEDPRNGVDIPHQVVFRRGAEHLDGRNWIADRSSGEHLDHVVFSSGKQSRDARRETPRIDLGYGGKHGGLVLELHGECPPRPPPPGRGPPHANIEGPGGGSARFP